MSGFRTSNQLSDLLLALLSGEEWKVTYYAIRRTMGLRRDRANISLEEFATGHVDDSGDRKDYGTGLCQATVIKCLREMKRFGVLIETAPADTARKIPAEYQVQTDADKIDILGLESRQQEQTERNSNRTNKARASKATKRNNQMPPSVTQTPNPPSVGQTERPLSDRESALCAIEPPPSVTQRMYKEGQKYHVSSKSQECVSGTHAKGWQVEEHNSAYKSSPDYREPDLFSQERMGVEVSDKDIWRGVLLEMRANGVPGYKIGTLLNVYHDRVKRREADERANPPPKERNLVRAPESFVKKQSRDSPMLDLQTRPLAMGAIQ